MTTMLSQRDGLKVLTQTLAVSSAERREALDITTDVRDGVRRAGIHKGLVIANCLHTTCSVLVAESGPALLEDFVRLMRRLIDDGKPYRHIEGHRTARVTSQGGEKPLYIDVPMPGQTLVTPPTNIRRFLAVTGHADLIEGVPASASRAAR